MKTKCINCNNEFDVPKAELNRGWGKFCSRSCSATYNNSKSPKKERRGDGRLFRNLSHSEKISVKGIKYVASTRVYVCKQRARKKNLDYDLDSKFIIELWNKQGGRCFYTGIPMTLQTVDGKITPTHMTVDRVDNSKGYTKNNVVLCCHKINALKHDLPVEDLLSFCSAFTNFFGP